MHGRALERVRPHLHPGAKVLALTSDGEGPAALAQLLTASGFGESKLTVLEALGVQDVVGKRMGSSNPYNMVRATFEALKEQASPRQVAAKRGKKVSDIIGRRADGAGADAEA